MTDKMHVEIQRSASGLAAGDRETVRVSLPRWPGGPATITLGPRPETAPRRGIMQHPRKTHPLVKAAMGEME